MTALLTDNLPLLAGAPNGIKKLRELILELAVRGKLVPQDPKDEPASELLKRIAEEKARLVAEGKIKRQKQLADIGEEEWPFELPEQWAWVRLADLAYPQAGFAFKSGGFNTSGLGLPLIRIRDVGQSFSGTFYEGEYRSEFVVERGDYLISMDGQFRVATWQGDSALLNQRVARLIFFGNESACRFIADSLQARLLELQGVKAYTTVDHLSGGQISEAIIALPPLAEQHRIVAKVDELMALCDRLEAQQADAESAHAQMVQALLDSLTQASDAADFAQSWQRLAEHFHTLFSTESSIDALKQALLQLAVMGKLVAQDPSDEPASELLNQKAILSAQRVDSSSYLPDGWCWVRGGGVAELVDPHPSHRTPPEVLNGVPYIGYSEISFITGINFDKARKVGLDVFSQHQARYQLKVGDFVFGKIGTIGKPFFLEPPFDYCLSANLILIQPDLDCIAPKYLAYYFDSPSFLAVLDRDKTNSTHAVFGIKKARETLVPLPPLAEQHRIVAKVDQLMALCDQLKARLTQARQVHEQLACTLVEQAVA